MRAPTTLGLAIVCACHPGIPIPDQGDGREQVVRVPVTVNRNLDLLFVIDDSGSMAAKQQNLAGNFPQFIDVLSQLPGGLPDLHVGVVTTDLGTKSSTSAPAPAVGVVGNGGCAGIGKGGILTTNGAPVQGKFISDIKQPDGTRLRNYTGDLAAVFSTMAKVGAGGCGFEQPLAAMRAALDNNPQNAGFIRPNALLGVMFLTDEDDCSVRDPALFGPGSAATGDLSSFRCTRFGLRCTQGGQTSDAMNNVGSKAGCTANPTPTLVDDVTPYRDFLASIKADPTQIVVGSIMGDPEPVAVEMRTFNGMPEPALAHSCAFQGATGVEVADPGTRMKAFLDQFPNHSAFSSVCQPDLSVALDLLGNLASSLVGSPCVTRALADSDTTMPGLQVDCIVEDNVANTATVIPRCNSVDAPPCWRLETDAETCKTQDHLKLTLVRNIAPSPATVVTMRCTVAQ